MDELDVFGVGFRGEVVADLVDRKFTELVLAKGHTGFIWINNIKLFFEERIRKEGGDKDDDGV